MITAADVELRYDSSVPDGCIWIIPRVELERIVFPDGSEVELLKYEPAKCAKVTDIEPAKGPLS